MAHHLLPPGRYYIGDPMYVFSDELGDKLVDAIDFDRDKIIEFNGFVLWVHTTSWGDGLYTDQNGAEFAVDSGLLGAIPIDLLDDPSGLDSGTIVDAPNGLHVEYEAGTFWLGNTIIKTEDDEEDDPYDGDPEDDEFI